jgi:hypothetical protein
MNAPRLAAFLLIALLATPLLLAAEGGTEGEGTLPLDDADLLRANTIVGLVRLARALDAAGADAVEFTAAQRDALILGMPPRIRGFLARIDAAGHAADVVAATIRRHPGRPGRRQLVVAFTEDWIAGPATGHGRFGAASVKGHVGEVYLSRARTVTATINASGFVDRRVDGGEPPYALCQSQRGILSEDAICERLPAHPWTLPGQQAPIGLEDVAGLSLQVRIRGWWKDATDIQPTSHLFVYADDPAAHIWIGYKELIGHVDRAAQRFQCENEAFDAGLPSSIPFPDYLGLAATDADRFSVSDLTSEGAPRE